MGEMRKEGLISKDELMKKTKKARDAMIAYFIGCLALFFGLVVDSIYMFMIGIMALIVSFILLMMRNQYKLALAMRRLESRKG